MLLAHCTYPFDDALLRDGSTGIDTAPEAGPSCGCVDVLGDCQPGASDRWICGAGGASCTRCDLPFDECRDGACAVSTPVVDLAASRIHGCAIDSAGTVYCTGTGRGVLPPRTDGPYVRIGAADLEHSCAVRANGTLSCWGSDLEGALGDGPTEGTPGPVEVSPGAGRWVAIASGTAFNCAVLELAGERQLHCWGYGSRHRLGLGTHDNMPAPVRVGARTDWLEVEAGEAFGCGTVGAPDEPELHCWGANAYGQAGRPISAGESIPTPMYVIGRIRRFALGIEHACAITTSARLLCWGRGDDGRLGLGDLVSVSAPTPVALTEVIAIAAGDRHTCAIAAASVSTGGALYCWGDGEYGQGGVGIAADQTTPLQVGTDTDWTDLWAGYEHTCALKRDGRLYCWGRNDHGEYSFGPTPLPLSVYPTPTETTP